MVIEGVENYTQISSMLKQGVKYGQGYLFFPPISKERLSSVNICSTNR
ncbi:biofilm formation regulator HmsP [Kluyvera cryocrescens]|uniref:Biofilm formation regulator HmsP n=1 Tax=Kluyvera cryocrescens TaxID=580 RepID=A0A485AQ17_KLUCR|nr:biofilm formation regulator HmsP [Kluyvera cryocrescens]